MKTKKLFEVTRNSRVRLLSPEHGPIAAKEPRVGEEYLFNHTDGMYSHCIDSNGIVVHLPAWSIVEVVKST